jgi:hypothetical protein
LDFEADKKFKPDITTNVSDKGKMMRRMRSVKVVATLGPASETYEVIRGLFEAGADVFRLNMSHGSHEEIREKHQTIRDIERDARLVFWPICRGQNCAVGCLPTTMVKS